MILLVDLCYEKRSLSQLEFVHPIADTLKRAGYECEVVHFKEINEEPEGRCDRIILCGTALKDNCFAKQIECFSWLKDCRIPTLGICAGMQTIASVFGARIIPQPAIGLKEIDIVKETPLLGKPRQIEGYHLHNFGVTIPQDFELLAGMAEAVEAFKHRTRPIYGIIFHPEVRNRWILERFAGL